METFFAILYILFNIVQTILFSFFRKIINLFAKWVNNRTAYRSLLSIFAIPGYIALVYFIVLIVMGRFFIDGLYNADVTKPDNSVALYWFLLTLIALTIICEIILWLIRFIYRREDGVLTFNISAHEVKDYLGSSQEEVLALLSSHPKIYTRTAYKNKLAKNFNGFVSGWKSTNAHDGERAEKYFRASYKGKTIHPEVNLSNNYINARCDFMDPNYIYEIKATKKSMEKIKNDFFNSHRYQLLTYLYLADKTKGFVNVYSSHTKMKFLKSFAVTLNKETSIQFDNLLLNIEYARNEIVAHKMWKRQ